MAAGSLARNLPWVAAHFIGSGEVINTMHLAQQLERGWPTRKGHVPSSPSLGGGGGERSSGKVPPSPGLAQSTPHTAATRVQVQFILHNREIQRAEV